VALDRAIRLAQQRSRPANIARWMMPLQGFIAPRHPMWLSTLAAMDRELVSDSP
jgi:hypothetical protein